LDYEEMNERHHLTFDTYEVYIDDRAMFVEVAQGLGIKGIIHTGDEATRKALEGLGLSLAS
jgi:hypothetical protein